MRTSPYRTETVQHTHYRVQLVLQPPSTVSWWCDAPPVVRVLWLAMTLQLRLVPAHIVWPLVTQDAAILS